MGQDPYQALLEILNPEEQSNFTDHYMDIKTDFSNCIFILTANSIMQMLEPLRNRLEIIKVDSYIEDEKLQIANNYLLPEIIDKMNVTKEIVIMNDLNILDRTESSFSPAFRQAYVTDWQKK
jgi:ATP-dependent Lon protease